MGTWQTVLIVISALGMGLTMAQHGQPKTGKENFYTSLIANALIHLLLWLGGWYA